MPHPTANEAPAVSYRTAWRALGLLLELSKARLSSLVVFTTAVGFVLAGSGGTDWVRLLWTVAGTALAAGCANALNQVMEVERDRRMERTRSRPLPSGSLGIGWGFVAAVTMGYAGLAVLAIAVNLAAAGLALAAIVIYVALYTPMKVRTSLNTLVGAVVGAIPPMIGWVAATGRLDHGAWVLAAILFVWQLPHFLALAWLYRDDYARGGFAMLPIIDRRGQLTCQVAVLTSLALLPIGLMMTMVGVAGWVYAVGSTVLGCWLLSLTVRLYRDRTNANARRVFFASICYLPLLLSLMLVDRGPIGALPTVVELARLP